jgi:DNA-binding protein HU-beta
VNVNKRELVQTIAGDAHLTRAQAAQALECFVKCIRGSLVDGRKVTISGFGTFAVARHKQRQVRDPQRGVNMTIRARSVPRFAPGLELRLAVEKAAATEDHRDQEHTLHTRSPG